MDDEIVEKLDDIIGKMDELENIGNSIFDELKIVNRVLIMVEAYLSDKVFMVSSNNTITDEEV